MDYVKVDTLMDLYKGGCNDGWIYVRFDAMVDLYNG